MADSADLPLASRHTVLRPPTMQLVDQLYELAATEQIPWLWRGNQYTPSGFRDSIYADNLVQFAVLNRRSGQPAGYLSAYDANPHHGFVYLTFVLLPDHRYRAWPVEGAFLFANYLFIKFNLRHIYGRSIEEHYQQFKSGAGRFFEVEGRLKNHVIVNGRAQDLYILTLSRERWTAVGPSILERITPTASNHPK